MSMHSTKELLTIIKRNFNIDDQKREEYHCYSSWSSWCSDEAGALLSNDDQRMLTSIKEMIRKNGKKIIYDFDYKIVGQMCGDEILEETRKPT
jgi:hypothetical protein